MLPQRLEVMATTAFDMMHENTEYVVANYFMEPLVILKKLNLCLITTT